MFATVKNALKRSKLQKLMTVIAVATATPAGFAFAPLKDAKEIQAAEPAFILIDENTKDATGNVAVKATADGLAAVAAPVAPVAAPVKFELQSGVAVPPANPRGGKKPDIYPFAQMEVGQSFFVPATTDKPNPAKSLASTVSSAAKRYAIKTGSTKPNRKGKPVPVLEFTRVFVVRPRTMEKDKEQGARVWRTK